MDNEELLRTSGLILTDEEGRTGITLAAILLFGTDNMIASACAHHKTDCMTKVGPGTSLVASGEVSGEVGGEVAADAVTIKLDVQKITDRKKAALNESSPFLKSIKSMLFQKPQSVPSAISSPP